MKRILILCHLLLSTFAIQAQLDRSKQPQPGPSPLIQLDDPQEFQLPNGITVLLVENHKLPRVSISLSIDNPLIVEGSKAGTNALLTSMMGKGSNSISKNDFEEEIDFMGTHFHFNSDGAHASSLSRYYTRVLELLADATLHPNFIEEEFEKEKEKTLTGIETAEKDVKTAARRVENLLSYGRNHPYGEYISKESVQGLKLDDIQEAYKYYYNPQNAYLVVVGDFDATQIKKEIKKYFGKWKVKTSPKTPFPEPKNAQQTEIAFVEMPNAVQSEISFINTIPLDKKNPDYFAAILANQILGGGAEARLFLNLREDKGFTYGAYSRLRDSHKTRGRFMASTSVRNAVTDSAVVEILHEVDKIRTTRVTDEELELVKAKYSGNFVISLEDPETIANFALNIKTQNLPSDFYKQYLKNVNAVTKEQVYTAAQKYFLSDNERIVVTGKGNEILEGLEQISHRNQPIKVRYFNKWGEETERPDYSKTIPEGITATSVIKNYLKAIGGEEPLKNIQSIKETAEATIQGMKIEIINYKTNQKQSLTEMKMMGNLMQRQVTNKTNAYIEMQGQRIDLEGDNLKQMLIEATIFPELETDLDNLEFVGLTEVDGQKAYEIKFSNSLTSFYDVESYLKIQSIQSMEIMGNVQTSTIKKGDYKQVDGILFPHKTSMAMGPQVVDFITNSIEINIELDSTVFE